MLTMVLTMLPAGLPTIPTNPPKIPANKARDKGDGGGKRKRRDVADNVPLVE